MKSVLVISPKKAAFQIIGQSLGADYKVDWAVSTEAGFTPHPKRRYEFVFLDLDLISTGDSSTAGADYKAIYHTLWQVFPATEIIVMAPQESIREAVKAVKAGAGNYLTFPLNPDELKYVKESIQESLKVQYELEYFRDRFWQKDALEVVRTSSPLMREVFNKVRAVAPTRTTVLLTGETGTGKGVVAKLLHRHSNRSEKQFISVHCGAIPETLLESELFGHEKGSFTGAIRRKLGKFEIAQGGTIFLDEIATVSAAMQVKLLQVVQERTLQRVGGEEVIEIDVRIIAATNDDLGRMCEDGSFRKDLFYRLNVFPIELPPLRERLEDIPQLADVFINRLNRFHLKDIVGIHPQVMDSFLHYGWPGNIREMENLIERAYILETSSILTPESFPSELFSFKNPRARLQVDTALTLAEVRRTGIENIERHYLKELLAEKKGRVNDTAAAAGVSVRQLHKLMTRYGIRKEEFKSPPAGAR